MCTLDLNSFKYILLSISLKFFSSLYVNVKYLGSVWYMYLKIENYYLKIFVKIRVNEKVHWNT